MPGQQLGARGSGHLWDLLTSFLLHDVAISLCVGERGSLEARVPLILFTKMGLQITYRLTENPNLPVARNWEKE